MGESIVYVNIWYPPLSICQEANSSWAYLPHANVQGLLT